MKRVFILLIVLSLVFPFVSANLESSFSEIESYIDDYNNGEITAPQLIVYIEYVQNKMYKDGSRGFGESEIKTMFTKVEQDKFQGGWGYYGAEYEKEYEAQDFNIVFYANSFVRQDREYYEERGDSERFYYIYYNLVSNAGVQFSIESEIKNFVSEIELTLDDKEFDYEKLKKDFSKIRSSLQRTDECSEIFEGLGFSEYEKDYESSKKEYYLQIATENEKNCWTKTHCEPREETKKDCYEGPSECYEKETCEEVCEEEVIYNEDNTTGVKEICHDECISEIVCEEGEEVCQEYTEYYDECSEEEMCDEFLSGELSLGGNCATDYSDIYLNAWGPFEKYNEINDFGDWNCENEIKSLVLMRKALEKDFNMEFIEWYFEDFLSDFDKIINGEGAIEEVIRKFVRVEEEIANYMHCSESGEWPEGFEKIDISYSNDNVNLEIWEKMIPVEGSRDYYTTLYKYSWAPDKELAKNLIEYMLMNESFGPRAKDIARIKSDEGQMELINRISSRYGGSFDVAITLKQQNSDFEIKKYLEINPEVAIRISDTIENKADISIDVDYDVLYNFIRQMTSKFEGDRIEGPYWVQVNEENRGPGNLFSAIGLISKAWREGVTVKPRYALIKLFFSAKDVMGFLSESSQPSNIDDGTTITGGVVLERV